MTFIFDEFEAAIGPRAGDTSKRALCKVNVTISSPGWAFDVGSVDFRGYVQLQRGVEASIVSRWKWVDLKSGLDLKGKVRLHVSSCFFFAVLCFWGLLVLLRLGLLYLCPVMAIHCTTLSTDLYGR